MGTDRQQLRRRPGARGATAGALQQPVLTLAGTIGNRSMGTLMRQPASVAPAGTATLPIKSFEPTREEVEAAEAWLLYLALRGRSPRPTLPLPDRYATFLTAFNDAVFGAQDQGKVKPVANARWFLRDLRGQHDKLIGGRDVKVFELAELALRRGAANARREGGEGAFDVTGATQLDLARTLMVIQSRADEELAAAKDMGYTIPEPLAKLGGQAGARYEKAARTWNQRAPGPETFITPAEEDELVRFRDEALETIGAMHRKRAADLARFHQAEADALRAAADKQLVELRAMLADRRRGLFMAGKTGELTKLHEASGQIVGVIDEIKATAGIITDRVDQLNAIAQVTSGAKLVNLPELPKGLTAAADKLKGAHAKLGKILELLDVLGPAKTEFEGGMKYLKGVDMALDHFSGKVGNPIFAIYVNSYLRPALQNCMENLGKIAGMISAQNRQAIGAGHPEFVTNWKVEPGGEGAYRFLAQVFKVGGAAAADDEAWAFFSDNAEDLGAAVGQAMPRERRALGAWASRNRNPLWEAFYGSTRPPR